MRKWTDRFIAWCADGSPSGRVEHTIVEGVLGVIAALVSCATDMPVWFTAGVGPVIMAVLTPIIATIGRYDAEADAK